MIQIGDNIEIPQQWQEMTEQQRQKAFKWLWEVEQGKMNVQTFRVLMFKEFTGYKPSRKLGFSEIEKENVTYNLLQLVEMITFAFDIEDKQIIFQPVETTFPPLMRWDSLNNFTVPFFRRGEVIDTNIRAVPYLRAVEWLHEIAESRKSKVDTTNDRNRLPLSSGQHFLMLHSSNDRNRSPLYNESQQSEVESGDSLIREQMQMLTAELYEQPFDGLNTVPTYILYGVTLWLQGVVQFFEEHPKYSVLFRSRKSIADTTNGRNRSPLYSESKKQTPPTAAEIIYELQKAGVKDIDKLRLPDYYDLQLKILRDRIQEAKANGVKTIDLIKKGVPVELIK